MLLLFVLEHVPFNLIADEKKGKLNFWLPMRMNIGIRTKRDHGIAGRALRTQNKQDTKISIHFVRIVAARKLISIVRVRQRAISSSTGNAAARHPEWHNIRGRFTHDTRNQRETKGFSVSFILFSRYEMQTATTRIYMQRTPHTSLYANINAREANTKLLHVNVTVKLLLHCRMSFGSTTWWFDFISAIRLFSLSPCFSFAIRVIYLVIVGAFLFCFCCRHFGRMRSTARHAIIQCARAARDVRVCAGEFHLEFYCNRFTYEFSTIFVHSFAWPIVWRFGRLLVSAALCE